MAYDIRNSFIIPTLVDDYAGAVEDIRRGRSMTWVYLLSHLLKVFLRIVAQFQRDSYKNFNYS